MVASLLFIIKTTLKEINLRSSMLYLKKKIIIWDIGVNQFKIIAIYYKNIRKTICLYFLTEVSWF